MSFVYNKWRRRSYTHSDTSASYCFIVIFGERYKIGKFHIYQRKNLFKDFINWQEGYGAFTYSIKEKDRLIEYVKNQEEHHRKKSFREEYVKLLGEHGIEFDEKYLL